MANLKYLEMAITNKNHDNDEIKSKLNSGNSYYCTVQNLLTKTLKTEIYKTVI